MALERRIGQNEQRAFPILGIYTNKRGLLARVRSNQHMGIRVLGTCLSGEN